MITPEVSGNIDPAVHQNILALRDSYTAGHTLNININRFHGPSARPRSINPVTDMLPYSGPFVGRQADLNKLSAFFDPSKKARSNIMLITGQPGVGKTAFAIQAIKAITETRTSSRALFVDLREHDMDLSRRLTLNSALESLLLQLGIYSEEIPPDTTGRETLFRSTLATFAAHGEQVVIAIDNVANYSSVHSLLPGTGQHRVLITSRYTMPELNAILLELGFLSPAESVSLLRKVASTSVGRRGKLGRHDLERLAFLCDCLPLALCFAAGRLVIEPHLALVDLINELSVASDRLDGLSIGDRGVGAAFHTSYERLTDDQAQMLRLCILHHGSEFNVPMAAAAMGISDNKARRILSELCRGHLVSPGTASGFFSLHDLVYRFAANLVQTENDGASLAEAAQRLFIYWRTTAMAAISHIEEAVPPDTPSGQFANYVESLEWLDLVSPSMVPTVRMATHAGHTGAAMLLGNCFSNYLILRRRFADLYDVSMISSTAAGKLGERHYEAEGLNNVGIALQGMDEYTKAVEIYKKALGIFQAVADQRGVAQATGNLGVLYEFLGRASDAIAAHLEDARICMKIGELRGYVAALNNLGLAYLAANQPRSAIRAHRRACKLAFASDSIGTKINAVSGLGLSYYLIDRCDKAARCHQRAKDMCRLIDDEYHFAIACGNLGRAERALGNFSAAMAEFKNAHMVFTKLGDSIGAAIADKDLSVTRGMDYYLIYSE